VAQGEGPKFKAQYHEKKKKKGRLDSLLFIRNPSHRQKQTLVYGERVDKDFQANGP
jgi:hypothetical protein